MPRKTGSKKSTANRTAAGQSQINSFNITVPQAEPFQAPRAEAAAQVELQAIREEQAATLELTRLVRERNRQIFYQLQQSGVDNKDVMGDTKNENVAGAVATLMPAVPGSPEYYRVHLFNSSIAFKLKKDLMPSEEVIYQVDEWQNQGFTRPLYSLLCQPYDILRPLNRIFLTPPEGYKFAQGTVMTDNRAVSKLPSFGNNRRQVRDLFKLQLDEATKQIKEYTEPDGDAHPFYQSKGFYPLVHWQTIHAQDQCLLTMYRNPIKEEAKMVQLHGKYRRARRNNDQVQASALKLATGIMPLEEPEGEEHDLTYLQFVEACQAHIEPLQVQKRACLDVFQWFKKIMIDAHTSPVVLERCS